METTKAASLRTPLLFEDTGSFSLKLLCLTLQSVLGYSLDTINAFTIGVLRGVGLRRSDLESRHHESIRDSDAKPGPLSSAFIFEILFICWQFNVFIHENLQRGAGFHFHILTVLY